MTDTTESTALRPASMPSAKGAYGAAKAVQAKQLEEQRRRAYEAQERCRAMALRIDWASQVNNV